MLKNFNIKVTAFLATGIILLSGCSSNFDKMGENSTSESCIGYLDSKGVFGRTYWGEINQQIFNNGVKSSSSKFIYKVDSKSKMAYYDTHEIGSTSLFLNDGSVINKADKEELKSLKPLFTKLGYPEPIWFKIEGELASSSTDNDPVISNYISLIAKHNSFKVDREKYTYTSWEGNNYKILEINCTSNTPTLIVTRYGEIKKRKAIDIIRTTYNLHYSSISLEAPKKSVLNYSKMLNTREGKIFIGKPITDIAFSFVMKFIKVVSPGKYLSNEVFLKYQNYIIESVNNDPEMNRIVLSLSGNNINGLIPLDGLTYYYCIKLDRSSGEGTIVDGKC